MARNAPINVHPEIRNAFVGYCRANGLTITRKIEKLLIMEMYKAGYEVKELIVINKRGMGSAKVPAKRPIAVLSNSNTESKQVKEEQNEST